jgi:hypothetical protein
MYLYFPSKMLSIGIEQRMAQEEAIAHLPNWYAGLRGYPVGTLLCNCRPSLPRQANKPQQRRHHQYNINCFGS